MTRRLLVVGGNGLLGRHLRPVAEREGWSPTVVALHSDIGVRACRSERALADLVGAEDWDAVIDLRAFDAPSTRVVSQAMKPRTTLILVSSIYAYCHPRSRPERDLRALTESAPQTPSGPYGSGKIAAEGEALSSAVDTVYAVRLPFVFGAGDRSERTQGFASFSSARVSVDETAYEVGLVSAAAVADRLIRLAGRRTPARQVLNIDSGRNWTLGEHLHAASRQLTGHSLEPASGDLPFNAGRDYSLNSSAAHQLLELDVDDDLDGQWRDVLEP